jgi:tRNA dimethylallyltransferase
MQLYRGLPIVTNKITIEEQAGIPHHLLGVIGLEEEPWRSATFKKHAQEIIQDIRSRGRLPILVGGTHYYTQGLLFQGSAIDAEDRSDVEELSREELLEKFPILLESAEVMHKKLEEVDPVMAERWHPKDHRKIQNSLLIYLQTGKRASDIYAAQKIQKSETAPEDTTEAVTNLSSTLFFWVHSDRETLNERLNKRVLTMMSSGLEEEVFSLERFRQDQLAKGVAVDQTRGIWVSIGWKEFAEYLDALELDGTTAASLDTLRDLSIEKTQAATRQYAKRQVQWIRHKLLSALTEEDAQENLYLVDSTDVENWHEGVYNPAVEATECFLHGLHMRSPLELSAAAQTNLSIDTSAEKPTLVQRECEMCGVTLMTDKQWTIHLQSRRHRALVKKAKKAIDYETHMQRQQEPSLEDEKS